MTHVTDHPLHTLTVAAAAARVSSRQISAEALTGACLDRIAQGNGDVNAFITVMAEEAMARARRLDAALASGARPGPLHGVPLTLKDLIDVAGVPTTAGSLVRRDHVAASNAPVTTRLLDAGAVILGKCNLHEFAFGTTNEDSGFGPSRHPRDVARSPGGSSGGSAAALARGMGLASVGTDTGGSIRIPAAMCGVVGLKPTVGEISTDGVVPLSTTLDHVGPLTRTVEDAGIMFEVLAGARVWDEWPRIAPRIDSLRIGRLTGYFTELVADDVRARVDAATDHLRGAGAHVEDITLPHTDVIAPMYLPIVFGEAAAYHGPLLETRAEDYTPAVRLRLELSRYVMAEDYVRALHLRRRLQSDVDRALAPYDMLLLPTVPVTAPLLGEPTVVVGGRPEPVRSVTLRLTQPFNLSGHPAVTLPCHPTGEGLPVGVQLVGHRHATPRLLQCARVCEPWIAGKSTRD